MTFKQVGTYDALRLAGGDPTVILTKDAWKKGDIVKENASGARPGEVIEVQENILVVRPLSGGGTYKLHVSKAVAANPPRDVDPREKRVENIIAEIKKLKAQGGHEKEIQNLQEEKRKLKAQLGPSTVADLVAGSELILKGNSLRRKNMAGDWMAEHATDYPHAQALAEAASTKYDLAVNILKPQAEIIKGKARDKVRDFTAKGHECDFCGRSLPESAYSAPRSWSYRCPNCGFKYSHTSGLSVEKQIEKFKTDDASSAQETLARRLYGKSYDDLGRDEKADVDEYLLAQKDDDVMVQDVMTCPVCKGSGEVDGKECPKCGGDGTLPSSQAENRRGGDSVKDLAPEQVKVGNEYWVKTVGRWAKVEKLNGYHVELIDENKKKIVTTVVSLATEETRDTERFTLAGVKSQLASKGITIVKREDEFIVNFKGGREATAYYTDDLEDALQTGLQMAKEGQK